MFSGNYLPFAVYITNSLMANKKKEHKQSKVTSLFESLAQVLGVFQKSEYIFSISVDNETCYLVTAKPPFFYPSFNFRSAGKIRIKKIK